MPPSSSCTQCTLEHLQDPLLPQPLDLNMHLHSLHDMPSPLVHVMTANQMQMLFMNVVINDKRCPLVVHLKEQFACRVCLLARVPIILANVGVTTSCIDCYSRKAYFESRQIVMKDIAVRVGISIAHICIVNFAYCHALGQERGLEAQMLQTQCMELSYTPNHSCEQNGSMSVTEYLYELGNCTNVSTYPIG